MKEVRFSHVLRCDMLGGLWIIYTCRTHCRNVMLFLYCTAGRARLSHVSDESMGLRTVGAEENQEHSSGVDCSVPAVTESDGALKCTSLIILGPSKYSEMRSWHFLETQSFAYQELIELSRSLALIMILEWYERCELQALRSRNFDVIFVVAISDTFMWV